jgi:hypothetical protein
MAGFLVHLDAHGRIDEYVDGFEHGSAVFGRARRFLGGVEVLGAGERSESRVESESELVVGEGGCRPVGFLGCGEFRPKGATTPRIDFGIVGAWTTTLSQTDHVLQFESGAVDAATTTCE